MQLSDLEEIERRVEATAHPSEGIIHKALKQWIAIEYVSKGVSVDKLEFEKKIYFRGSTKLRYSTADVFIDQDGGIVFYCQVTNDYPWLYKFLEQIPYLKEYSKYQYVVMPENLEALYPMRWQQYKKELSHIGVDVIVAPFSIPVENKQHVQIDMTYNALDKLVKIKNKFNSNKSLSDFIEKDLERIIKHKEGFPLL